MGELVFPGDLTASCSKHNENGVSFARIVEGPRSLFVTIFNTLRRLLIEFKSNEFKGYVKHCFEIYEFHCSNDNCGSVRPL